MRYAPTFLLLVVVSLLPMNAQAQWQVDGVPVCTTTLSTLNDNVSAAMAPDGTGGAIVVWTDYRNGASNTDIFAQRVDASGIPQWTTNGVAVCTSANLQQSPTIATDGAGGAIITWQDARSGDVNIRAQRLNALGSALWTTNGVSLCNAANLQQGPRIVSDGAGGAIVTWQDRRSGEYDIYVQRVSNLGIPQWAPNGVYLCVLANQQSAPLIVSDGAGGAVVTWIDSRNGIDYDIYAQRVNVSGVQQWTANGVALCTAIRDQFISGIASDGAGGALVSWRDDRNNASMLIEAWNDDGEPGSSATYGALCYAFPYVPSVSYELDRIDWYAGNVGSTVTTSVRADSLNGPTLGSVTYSEVPPRDWQGANLIPPVPVIAGQTYYLVYTIGRFDAEVSATSDENGNFISHWADYSNACNTWMGPHSFLWRARFYGSGGSDIYAQRVNAVGVPQWAADGVGLCTLPDRQNAPAIVSDGVGGAIVAWSDGRIGSPGIYAQRVNPAGITQWTADGIALCATTPFEVYYPTIVTDGTGGAIVTWYDARGGYPNYDIYAQRVNPSGIPQWTANGVALCTAIGMQFYPTIVTDDAGGAIVTWQDFRTGGTWDIYSQHVANTPTAVAIVSFDAFAMDGAVTLRSAFRSDLHVQSVNVYRSAAGDPLNIIERTDNVRGDGFEYVDRDVAPGQTYRYQIGVVDADGEFFSPIATVSVNAVAGELSQNQPNPFNPTTTIRFTLPAREDVTLAIYDTNGHLVRMLVNDVQENGAHEVTWDGRDDAGVAAGSGVYFYRLHAGKLTESKKMVLLK